VLPHDLINVYQQTEITETPPMEPTARDRGLPYKVQVMDTEMVHRETEPAIAFELGAYVELTRHFPYRVAWPTRVVLRSPYEHGDPVDELHRELARRTGHGPDNHEGFELRHQDGGYLYVFFSDWHLTVALSAIRDRPACGVGYKVLLDPGDLPDVDGR
jgi:hypothetical protein